ncbi:MAG: hypothetical protein U1F26_16685 [Lysobacterales bacterium]
MNEMDELRRKLSELPIEAPPPSVWLNLQMAQAELCPRPRLRRGQRWRVAAAVVLLALAPALVWRMPQPPPAQAYPDAAAALRAVDRELQQQYVRGASDAELEPLWRQRELLLRQLESAPDTSPTIRI